ncbi:MAG: GMC family oxidoreductase [Rhodospirillales bacterium]|nr:GMC family oxidoreductase [Rhodospirillales bacterium]
MFIDARTVDENVDIETDLCVIGGGAGGISLAREFMNGPVRVCLLESGGLKAERETQSLYEGESVGIPYELDTTRSRYFGGSTNCWGGFSRPFQPIHFTKRPWVPYSGWPFTFEELAPYYDRAHAVCGLPIGKYDPDVWVRELNGANLKILPFPNHQIVTRMIQTNKERRRFGRVFREELQASDNISVYLYANVVDIQADELDGKIKRVRVACLDGRRFWVSAKVFVLAAGGIENARLLLTSNTSAPRGLANDYDLVGRFFMEHATFPSGTITFTDPEASPDIHDTKYAVVRLPVAAQIELDEETQRREQILDSATFIESVFKGEQCAGTEVLKTFYKDARSGFVPKNLTKGIGEMLLDAHNVTAFALGYLSRSRHLLHHYQIMTLIEPAPNPDSRVMLSHHRDQLGMNKVCLDWRLTPLDQHTVRRTIEIFRDKAAAANIGEIRIDLPLHSNHEVNELHWVWHHMGTTRMHVDPKQGVVNEHCRAHGIGNLFVAGSSVFPTAGNNTPTMTIIALALRLSDHLKGVFAERRF